VVTLTISPGACLVLRVVSSTPTLRPVSDDADGRAVLPKHTMAGGCQPVSRHIEARMLVVNRGGVAVGSPSSSNY
jgi:hypothetical protein